MFASRNHRLDFADTRLDPLDQIAHADRADRQLLRLVCCAALATLVMALASSLA